MTNSELASIEARIARMSRIMAGVTRRVDRRVQAQIDQCPVLANEMFGRRHQTSKELAVLHACKMELHRLDQRKERLGKGVVNHSDYKTRNTLIAKYARLLGTTRRQVRQMGLTISQLRAKVKALSKVKSDHQMQLGLEF